MMMMMRMVVKLRMIMFVRNLGNCLQTALPCRRALMRVGSRKVCGNGNDVDIHVGFNVDLEAQDDTDKLVPSVRPCLPTDPGSGLWR